MGVAAKRCLGWVATARCAIPPNAEEPNNQAVANVVDDKIERSDPGLAVFRDPDVLGDLVHLAGIMVNPQVKHMPHKVTNLVGRPHAGKVSV